MMKLAVLGDEDFAWWSAVARPLERCKLAPCLALEIPRKSATTYTC